MKVLVTGATGVLGRASLRALIDAGHEVRGAARGEEKAGLVRSLGAEPVEVDLFDPTSVNAAVANNEAVLHFATKIPPIIRVRLPSAWRENDRLRTEATRVLVDSAIETGVEIFVYESISFIYGDHGDEWIDEATPPSITWTSLNSTMDAEREMERFRSAGGRGVSLRYATFYSPHAQSTLDTVRLARRRLLPVPGDGSNFISSIHVDDAAAAAVAAVAAAPFGVYNITDDEPLRMRDYVTALTDAFSLKPPRRVPKWLVRLLGGKPAGNLLNSQRVSNARFKEATGWSPRYTSAREGWRQIADELSVGRRVGA